MTFENPDDEGEGRRLPRPAVLKAVKAAYRRADEAFQPFSCDGTAECCQLFATKREPHLWPSEWAVLDRAISLRADIRPREDGGCALLDDAGKRCTVYADRPLGCRTFFCGRVKGPARQPAEVMDALSCALRDLSRDLGDEGEPKRLSELLAERTAAR